MTSEAGREEALRLLAGRVARRGFRIAHDLLGSRAEAEDAVQEALARACAGYGRLRDRAALDGWFYRILTNTCLRVLRRRRIWRALGSLFGSGADEEEGRQHAAESALPDPAPAVDEALGRARTTAAMLDAVERLPPMQRAALLLRYGHDLSVAEIAAMLDVGLGTVKTHLVRGLDRLRTTLGGTEESRP